MSLVVSVATKSLLTFAHCVLIFNTMCTTLLLQDHYLLKHWATLLNTWSTRKINWFSSFQPFSAFLYIQYLNHLHVGAFMEPGLVLSGNSSIYSLAKNIPRSPCITLFFGYRTTLPYFEMSELICNFIPWCNPIVINHATR